MPPRNTSSPSSAHSQNAPGGAAAVDRALSLLAAFRARDTSLSLTELAQRTGLYKSTALRLLASLEHARFVHRQPDGAYVLGNEIARLHAIHAASFSLEHVVLPELQRLVKATGESAAFHVRRGEGRDAVRLCLYRVDSPHPVRDHIRAGDVLPIDRGTGARVLMAFDPALAALAKPSERRVLAQVREQGWCASIGDRLAEVAGISAPVFRADGTLAAALTLTMPAHRYDERYVKPVLEAARRLSGQV